MYWQTIYRVPGITDVMAQKRFLTIFANLAATSNQERPRESTNIYWKVAPIIDAVHKTCVSLPPEENNSIDEQMIPFQGRVPGRQYVKNKPNPVAVKLFVLCGQSGMAKDFEFYQGKGTGVSEDHKDLGLGGSIVMRLVENFPERENFKVYFDNFFTSIPLLIQLKEKGFHALSVLKTNRMSGAILKSKGDMKRQGRSAMDSCASKSGDITIVR